MTDLPSGFDEMRKYPLLEALFKRRSRRIGLGTKSVRAGTNTYTSNSDPHPLSELEEAILIPAAGLTGLPIPAPPFESTTAANILGTPTLNMPHRPPPATHTAHPTH